MDVLFRISLAILRMNEADLRKVHFHIWDNMALESIHTRMLSCLRYEMPVIIS